jgi:hypothetical protein
MASAAISVDRLERGDLPLVCAKTGAPTRHRVVRRHRVIPGWTWVLLPFGVLPFVLAAMLFTRRTITVSLPITKRARRRQQLAERIARWSCFAGVLAVLWVAFEPVHAAVPWAVPAALLAAAAVAYVVARQLWVGVHLSYTTAQLVHLRRVHPAFATAVAERLPVPNDWLDELGYERIMPRARLARRTARIAS